MTELNHNQEHNRPTPKRRKHRWKLLRRITFGLLIFTIGSIGLGMFYQTSASENDKRSNPAPGELIDIGEHHLHLNCIGEGSPTVILESGLGNNSLVWTKVQPEVAAYTQVCSYDRAGLGWSEASSKPRTSQQIVQELHTLLANAKIKSPYVLVGHSFGGINVRVYADMYPEQVAGIILVDSAHPAQFSTECDPGCFPSELVEQISAMYGFLPALSRIGIVRLLVPTGQLPLPFFVIPETFTPEEQQRVRASMSTTKHSDTLKAEWDAYPASANQATRITSLGDMPLLVLTADSTYTDAPLPGVDPIETTNMWLNLQADLTTLSTNSEHIVVESANHFSLIMSDPHGIKAVVDSIRQMIESS